MIYAQINEENICIVISDMGEVEVSDKHLIPIEVYDKESMLNKLDVFLMANRITEAQYNELVGMIA